MVDRLPGENPKHACSGMQDSALEVGPWVKIPDGDEWDNGSLPHGVTVGESAEGESDVVIDLTDGAMEEAVELDLDAIEAAMKANPGLELVFAYLAVTRHNAALQTT